MNTHRLLKIIGEENVQNVENIDFDWYQSLTIVERNETNIENITFDWHWLMIIDRQIESNLENTNIDWYRFLWLLLIKSKQILKHPNW